MLAVEGRIRILTIVATALVLSNPASSQTEQETVHFIAEKLEDCGIFDRVGNSGAMLRIDPGTPNITITFIEFDGPDRYGRYTSWTDSYKFSPGKIESFLVEDGNHGDVFFGSKWLNDNDYNGESRSENAEQYYASAEGCKHGGDRCVERTSTNREWDGDFNNLTRGHVTYEKQTRIHVAEIPVCDRDTAIRVVKAFSHLGNITGGEELF